jgi:ATP/maltotriose-dependent transcriptional regulator MalT
MALLGEWQKSVLAAASARSQSPENAEASALQAYSLVKSGRPNEAETLLTHALRQTEGATGRARALALVASGALAEARGSKANAISAYQNAGNADESCALPYLAFADYARRNGNSEIAKKLLQGGLNAVKTPAERAAIRARLGAY